MDLKDYFENTQGRGVLATADRKGKVDAAYLFMESGQGFVGKNLFFCFFITLISSCLLLDRGKRNKDSHLADGGHGFGSSLQSEARGRFGTKIVEIFRSHP